MVKVNYAIFGKVIFFTIKDLKFRQIFYRIYRYFYKPRIKYLNNISKINIPKHTFILDLKSKNYKNGTIKIGKYSQNLGEALDPSLPLLFKYKFHYLDYILDTGFNEVNINHYIEKYKYDDIANEPYPLSKRILYLSAFYLKKSIKNNDLKNIYTIKEIF